MGENQFGLRYSDEANPDGFTSLQLIVRDASAAEEVSSDDFTATVQIGPLLDGTSYHLDPSGGDGSGSVEIEAPDTDSATVRISGDTADGVQLDATVTCDVVFDFGG